MPPKDSEIHVVCTEQKRLTEMETTLKFLREDTLKRHEEKLDRICNILENGLTAKVNQNSDNISQIKTDVGDLKTAYLERPKGNDGEPVERRIPPSKPVTDAVKRMPKSAKITLFVLIATFVIDRGTWIVSRLILLFEWLLKIFSNPVN